MEYSLQAKNSQNHDLEKQRFYSIVNKNMFSNSSCVGKIKMLFRQLLIERRQELEERTLASSERGLGLLYESEKVRF